MSGSANDMDISIKDHRLGEKAEIHRRTQKALSANAYRVEHRQNCS